MEKQCLPTRNPDTLKYVERKLADKGLHRLERHPVDGYGGIGKGPHKGGHGGKYTWEGPSDDVANELENDRYAAVDKNDPNYVDEEKEEDVDVDVDVKGLVVGEVPVAKEAAEGVARIDVDPRLLPNV
ncbi:hypothetical protein ACFE04_002452 [Oxalis oulophora]